MGRDIFSKALSDPESLLEPASDPTVEVCAFEEFPAVPIEVYGDDIDHEIEPLQEPIGEPWEEDKETLQKMFPRLWDKFGWE